MKIKKAGCYLDIQYLICGACFLYCTATKRQTRGCNYDTDQMARSEGTTLFPCFRINTLIDPAINFTD